MAGAHERIAFIKERKHIFRGTGAGLFGTLEAAAAVILGARFSGWNGVIVLSALTVLSAYLSGRAEKILGVKDDPRIIIDEIVGYFWSVAFLPLDLLTGKERLGVIILAFILFRICDVYKIPSKKIQSLDGGWGVMMDDVLSGLFVCALLNFGVRILL